VAAYSTPRPSGWNRWIKGEYKEWEWAGQKGTGKEGWRWKGKGEEGKGRDGRTPIAKSYVLMRVFKSNHVK